MDDERHQLAPVVGHPEDSVVFVDLGRANEFLAEPGLSHGYPSVWWSLGRDATWAALLGLRWHPGVTDDLGVPLGDVVASLLSAGAVITLHPIEEIRDAAITLRAARRLPDTAR